MGNIEVRVQTVVYGMLLDIPYTTYYSCILTFTTILYSQTYAKISLSELLHYNKCKS